MIRVIGRYGKYERGEEPRHLVRAPSVAYFVSMGSCEIGTETGFGSVDLPPDACTSQLVVHLPVATSIVQFSTEDAVARERRDHDEDDQLQLLEDTRAYLDCLARGAQPGSQAAQAWEHFFHGYTRRIRRTARICGLSAADAEDCVQDVWMAILSALQRSDDVPQWDRFYCWIRGLIHNQVVDFVRRLARRPDRWALSLDDAVSSRYLDPVASCEQSERRKLVRHVLGDLQQQVSTTNYRVIQLRWMEDRGVSEIAARLDLTSEQVWYRHHRVKKHLRRLFECHGARSE